MAGRIRITPSAAVPTVIGAAAFFGSVGPSAVRDNLADWLGPLAIVDFTSGLTWRWIAGMLGLSVMLLGLLRPDAKHLVRFSFWRRKENDSAAREAWQQLSDQAAYDADMVKAWRSALSPVMGLENPKPEEVAGRITKLVGEMQRLNGELTNITTSRNNLEEMFGIAESERESLARQVEQLTSELNHLRPTPLAPEPLNRELVIAIKTYGYPAYEALTVILQNMWEPVRELQGIGKFLPSAWLDSTGHYIRDCAQKLADRIEQGDNGEPFFLLWQDFHRTYGTQLMFWIGRVHYFHPAQADDQTRLQKWLPLHDQYYARIRELGNAPDGQNIKGWFETFDQEYTTYRERLVEAMRPSSPTPDTEGSPS